MPSPEARSKKIRIAFFLITGLFFLVLAGFAWIITDIRENQSDIKKLAVTNNILAKENKHRITEIQDSRTESCKTTYDGIGNVFRPFFPPVPRTEKQQEQLDKFNNKIKELKAGCTKQTKPTQSKPSQNRNE